MSGAHRAVKAARKRERITDPAAFLAVLAEEGAAATTLRTYQTGFQPTPEAAHVERD